MCIPSTVRRLPDNYIFMTPYLQNITYTIFALPFPLQYLTFLPKSQKEFGGGGGGITV